MSGSIEIDLTTHFREIAGGGLSIKFYAIHDLDPR